MSSNRDHPCISSGGSPAQAFIPKLIGSRTPSITHASPCSKRSIRGARSRRCAGTRAVQRSPGSLTWLSPEIRRYERVVGMLPSYHGDGMAGIVGRRSLLPQAHSRTMRGMHRVVFVAYPGITALDLVGPHEVLGAAG